MKSRDFIYWLQGFVELHPSPDKEWSKDWHPDAHQWKLITQHLSLVFKHEIDPEMGDAKQQEILNQIHTPGGIPFPSPSKLPGIVTSDPHTLYRC